MQFFKSKYERQLDLIAAHMEMNCSNNYKDAAQKDLKDYEELLQALLAEGKLNDKSQSFYKEKLESYKKKMNGFTHKDQKPYWT